MAAKVLTWDVVSYRNDEQPADTGLTGRRQEGYPIRMDDGTVVWVESHQWKILPDGSREPRRYRVVRMNDDYPGGLEPFPFGSGGSVQESDTEQGARNLLVRIVDGKV